MITALSPKLYLPFLQPCLTTEGSPELTLLICPFAGGSSSAFRRWSDLTADNIDVLLVIYPGRERRMQEPAVVQIAPLAEELADLISRLSSQQRCKLVLVGHSMGAQVAFEACLLLEQRRCAPKALVLSGCHAPHLSSRRLLSHLPDKHFIESLVDIGGCSAALQEEPMLLSLFLPMLRADFLATEGYQRSLTTTAQQVHTPTLLLHGTTDKEATADEVWQWRHWLHDKDGQQNHFQNLPGDHFYITEHPQPFIHQIKRFIQRLA